jgi:hypothetical protein
MSTTEPTFDEIEATLKKVVTTFREADFEFALAGSLASWARGGPETRHDLDIVIRPRDADRSLRLLAGVGMRTERPPEEWLVKAYDGDVLVDLIFSPKGLEVGDDLFQRADDISVFGVTMPVMAIEDIIATKLLAMSEHTLRYESVLQIARAVREQVDWSAVYERAGDSPYAKAFFLLLEELGIARVRPAEGEEGGPMRLLPRERAEGDP